MSNQEFGGDWTEKKLSAIDDYLQSYMKIMRRSPATSKFRVSYVDGFAGSGRRYVKGESGVEVASESEGSELRDELKRFYSGSAFRALSIDLPFDHYLFIEPNSSFVKSLDEMAREFPNIYDRVSIKQGDANEIIPAWCNRLEWNDRALMFLDPYGMQVSWDLLKAIAKTKKIDTWILVPIGQAVIRVMPKRQTPPHDWANALTRFFGTDEWITHYEKRQEQNLFESYEVEVRSADFRSLTNFFISRLKSIFSGVLEEPIILKNSQGTPLYILCFAIGNPSNRAIEIALGIAKHIAGKLNDGN